MEKAIKYLEGIFKPVLSPIVTKLSRPLQAAKQFPQKSAALIRKFLQTTLYKEEKSLRDYVPIGRYYVAKRLLLFLLLAIAVIVYFLFIRPPIALLKWLNLPVVLYTYEERTKSFTGKGELFDGHDRLVYKGDFENGIISGKGRLYDETGTLRYEGEFQQGKKNGQGVAYDEQGRLLYKGNFVDDQYSGNGILYDPATGKILYDGELQYGMKAGQGKEFYPNGTIKYEGTLQNNLYNGEGKYYHETGTLLYAGGFLNGLYDGNGTEYYANGLSKYVGAFSRNLYHGQGTLFDDAGHVIYKGAFREGKFHGTGEEFYPDGNPKYTGEFQNGQYHGFGTLYDENGNIRAKGLFAHGKIDYGKFIGIPVQKVQEWLGEPPETAPLLHPEIGAQLAADPTQAAGILPSQEEAQSVETPALAGDEPQTSTPETAPSAEVSDAPPPYMLYKYPLEGMMLIVKTPQQLDEYAVVDRVILTSPETVRLVAQTLDEWSETSGKLSVSQLLKSGNPTIYYDIDPYLYTISLDPNNQTIKRIQIERIGTDPSQIGK